MTKRNPFITICLITAVLFVQLCAAKATSGAYCTNLVTKGDTTVPADVMQLIRKVIASTDNFNIEAVAELYTPNAVVADDEPPYSWNGPTAGVQWVNAVEKACRDNRLTKLRGTIGAINIIQQSADNTYIVVPVNYTGVLPERVTFTSEGAFTFVLRLTNGKWLIKSQVWIPRKGM